MDENNLYKSFNELIEENEGWILTKNEHGKVKVSSCKEDETNIYEKTRDWLVIGFNKTRIDLLQLPKPELGKIVNLFIRDLLNSERKNGYFLFKSVPYVEVFICGTLVSFYVKNNKYYTIVDDGTSCIKCIISKDHLSILKEDEDSNSSIEKSASSVTMKAATMTNVSKTSLRNSVPEFSELELGSIIKIIGTIDEYDGNRYIFPKKIVKEPKGTIFHCTHLENLIQQYTETFNK
ncbi:uncharacterized protein isoform X1 [Leptinotarsa decemlineata]|uniref:uncharacterized protein isoform X1 n=1 Tax=Leptinotarsa decemlineata TaxID=7539 RepID=UPI000C2556C3|nr:uncharacterized protein LOC111505793 isoform X1 [Leptinotarsa decemlineata]